MENSENVIVPDVLLVIGNGFDRQCDLKSSYYDFFMYILKKNEEYEEVDALLNEYVDYIEECCLKFNILYYSQDYAINWKIEKLNFWYSLFLYKKSLLKKDWNLIEEQILQEVSINSDKINIFSKIAYGIMYKYILENSFENKVKLVFSDLENKLIPNIYNVLSHNLYTKINYKKYNNEIYKKIIDTLNEWMRGINAGKLDRLVVDNNSKEKVIVEVDKERDIINCISEILLEELKEVENDFIEYLNNELEVRTTYLENSKKLIKYLLEINKYSSKLEDYNIISFNYTVPWEEFSYSRNLFFVNLSKNIHGTLKNRSIIFGIDDNKIDSISEGYRFTKVSRIMEMNAFGKNKSIPINSVLSPSIKKVVFYGHSLSDADYGYFKMIFDEYVNKKNVCFEFCYTLFEGTTEKNEIIKLREGISRLFGRYEKEKLENQYRLKSLNLNNRIQFREIPNIKNTPI